ncbi:MAG: putative sporulation protein YtxC [Clostridia bacterium]|nr:putative sporulation protein YtxC [Clostridia bacterium]
MKSIAIKTNNSLTIEYLKENLSKINSKEVSLSCKDFKHFTNIIVHYKGNNTEEFIKELATILSFLVIYEFEEDFFIKIINQDYFYFSKQERDIILENCFNIIIDSNTIMKNKFKTIYTEFLNYLLNNKNLYLSGFINFKIPTYLDILKKVVEDAVNSFILEKEYNEFISLLRLYINSENSLFDTLHIVYSKDFTLILDEDKRIIDNSKEAFKAKFLSDISFSVNDYTLNTLLTLLPKKIYVHLIDNNIDEFITTLTLIFENRLEICTNCNICTLYKDTELIKNKSQYINK